MRPADLRPGPPGVIADPGRTVTSKVLLLLEAFESARSPLSLTQLAEFARLPMPTALRLVRELVVWGALERDANGRYAVGLRLWEVAQGAGGELRDAARPFLQDLFSLTQETVHLAVREGDEALYIDRLYSTKRVPRAARVGGRLPLHATGVGKVLLAFEEPWIREAYLGRDLESPTRHTHVQPGRLLDELAAIRKQGYATTHEEVRAGSCSIAVPVLRDPDHAAAAIGLVMLSTESDRMPRFLPALHGTARRIEPVLMRWHRFRLPS